MAFSGVFAGPFFRGINRLEWIIYPAVKIIAFMEGYLSFKTLAPVVDMFEESCGVGGDDDNSSGNKIE